jgi:DNA-binding LacI/PurR family transcriptional regulator
MAKSLVSLIEPPLQNALAQKGALRGALGRAVIGVQSWIQSNDCRYGDILPSEVQLCGELGVARGTLRSALAILEKEGWVGLHKGRGRIVRRAPQGRMSLMARTIALITHFRSNPADERDEICSVDQAAAVGIGKAGYGLYALHLRATRKGIELDEQIFSAICHDPPVGLLVGPTASDYALGREAIAALADTFPVVACGNDAVWANVDRVYSNHKAGARALTQLLLSEGRRRILRIWSADERHYWLKDRNAGHEEAMAGAGLTPLPPVCLTGYPLTVERTRATFETCVRVVAGYLAEWVGSRRRIDAIMATSDTDAVIAAAALRLFDIEPNVDIAIVGYDHACPRLDFGFPEFEHAAPWATVDKQEHEMGRAMVRILEQRRAGQASTEARVDIHEPIVIRRNS